jgi:Flp pilus assembly protein TadB
MLAAAAGASVGAGVWLVAREVWPAGPDLAAVLARGSAPPPRDLPTGWRLRLGRAARPVVARVLPVAPADLAITRTSPEGLAAQVVLGGLCGLLGSPLLAVVAGLLGVGVPLLAVPLIGVAVGLLAAVSPVSTLRSRARRARLEFRVALAAYLDLVALERAADAGAADAVFRAATVGDGWAFALLRDALKTARLSGISVWQSLAGLGVELGVPELADLADIVGLAASDGARMLDTLAAKAESMRGATLAEDKTRANAASTRMQLPAAAIFYTLLVLLLFPLLVTITS